MAAGGEGAEERRGYTAIGPSGGNERREREIP